MIKPVLIIISLVSLITVIVFISNSSTNPGQNKEKALGMETNSPEIASSIDPDTGEIKNIQVTSTTKFDQTNYSYPTTFKVSGSAVNRYTGLKATIIYYIDQSGSPYQKTIDFNLKKLKNGQFQGSVIFPILGCVDLKSPKDVYIASFCVKNNAVGANRSAYVFGADTYLPFKYEQDGYIWGMDNTIMRIAYTYMGQTGIGTPRYAVQALTATFNKNNNPYYQANNPETNFKPTSMYWTVQSDLPIELVRDIGYWIRPNTTVTCEAQNARLGLSKNMSTKTAKVYYNMYNWNAPDCWFRTDSSIWQEQFPNNSFLKLVP